MGATEKAIEEFISITGADHDTAKHMLDACSNNLETAVTMFLDGKTDGSTPGATAGSSSSNPDNVRSPIPQTSGVLVDGPRYGATSNIRWRPRRKARSVFDGFRDFKDGTTQQEDILTSNPAKRRRMKRLEDLFRPPVELMHKGNFETAREDGKSKQKWLMVNVQNVQEFCCQVLNRDVWSKPQVQRIIKEHFIFWQVYTDSPDGERFMTFYNVTSWPHVSIIDPRTGERLVVWKDVTANSISGKIEEFLADHGTIGEEENEPPSKRSKQEELSVIDDSEDLQLAAAIAASLQETKSKTDTDDLSMNENSDLSELEATDDDHTTIEYVSDHECEKFGTKMASSTDDNGIQNGVHNLSVLDDIENTKVEGDYFSIKNTSEILPKMNGNCSNNELTGKNKTIKDKKGDKKYKKVRPKGLKLGSIKNGKDLSNLTKDKYGDSKVNKKCAEDEQPAQEEVCQIMIRLPDGAREQTTLSSDLTIEHLVLKLEEKGFPSDKYEIVTNFPRKNLSTAGHGKTLKELGLHPRAAVFVQERD